MGLDNMDTNIIAFIICVNNDQYYDQCIRYIQELAVPSGYEIDVICVKEAQSMAAGYHTAMQSSSAKYKVYLHQDTFIINKKFIYDILQVFDSDKNIGMLGVIGVMQLPKDANCYMEWNTGRVLSCDGAITYNNTLYQDDLRRPVDVGAIDGVLMATQYDIPWREELFTGWDFYDVSQSLEMQRMGHKVVIPYQEEIWCYHDCGASKLIEYDRYRVCALEEYREYFEGETDAEEVIKTQEAYQQLNKVKSQILYLFEMGLYDELEQIFIKNDFISLNDTEIRELVNVINIYHLEKKQYGKVVTDIFRKSWMDTQREYRSIKFEVLYNFIRCKKQKEEVLYLMQNEEITISEETLKYIIGVIH